MYDNYQHLIIDISADKKIKNEDLIDAFSRLYREHQELNIENRRLLGDNKTLYALVHELKEQLNGIKRAQLLKR